MENYSPANRIPGFERGFEESFAIRLSLLIPKSNGRLFLMSIEVI